MDAWMGGFIGKGRQFRIYIDGEVGHRELANLIKMLECVREIYDDTAGRSPQQADAEQSAIRDENQV